VLGHSEEPESGYNAVRVNGLMPETYVPQLQAEPIEDGDSSRSPVIGETCYVRVYWAGNEPTVMETYVTSGIIKVAGGGKFYTDIEEEVVEFKDGIATVSLPVFDLLSYQWIGDAGGKVNFTRHGTELSIEAGKFRLARVRYRTRFKRYQLEKHNVERLMAVLFLTVEPAVSVFVRTASEPVEGDTIDAPLLTSEHAAVARGTAWIDQQYRKSICDITVPYSDIAVDGKIAFIDDSHIGSPGNYHITRSEIVIEGPMTTNQLRLEKCLTSFNT
jgi:hypothetical protein